VTKNDIAGSVPPNDSQFHVLCPWNAHTLPASHGPQLPPQVSSPHVFPAQFGVQVRLHLQTPPEVQVRL